MNSQGSKILASVGDRCHAYFKRVLQEGLWFEISGFLLRRSNREKNKFNMTRSDYVIHFNKDTRVQSLDVTSDKHFMDFADFFYVVKETCDGVYPVGKCVY